MNILVETILRCDDSCDNEIVEKRNIIDYFDSSDRKWLRNHCIWAFHNGRKICTSRTTESINGNLS